MSLVQAKKIMMCHVQILSCLYKKLLQLDFDLYMYFTNKSF